MDEISSENENEMDKFFTQIVELTDNSSNAMILKNVSDRVFEIITRDFKKNIQIAAMRGFNEAYICLYDVNARYKGTIPIDCFIHMSEHTRTKFEEFKLEPVVDRLRKFLAPFHLEIRFIDSVPSDTSTENILAGDTPAVEPLQVVAIVVTWPRKVEQKTINSVNAGEAHLPVTATSESTVETNPTPNS
jgi:hypothetical protein